MKELVKRVIGPIANKLWHGCGGDSLEHTSSQTMSYST